MLKKVIVGVVFVSSMLLAKANVEYSINAVGMSMDYKEYDDGKLADSESSGYTDLTGAEFKYNYIMQDASTSDYNNIALSIMALGGDTEYMGSYIGYNQVYGSQVNITSNKIYDVDLDFAHTYQQTQNYKVIISLGVGYRFWRRELSAQQVEDYKWYSLRPSLAFSYTYKGLSVSPEFEYQYGIRPRMKCICIANEEFKLSSANIVQVSIPLEYAMNQCFSLYSAYTYQYQNIKESDVVYDNDGTGYYEPQSEASNKYIKFGIIFKY